MFSMCSELTPRARIPDTRIPQLMQPCWRINFSNDISAKHHLEYAYNNVSPVGAAKPGEYHARVYVKPSNERIFFVVFTFSYLKSVD